VRSLALVFLLAASPARAQPGDPAAQLAQCKARRQEIAREAQAVASAEERARIYQTMPDCHLGADGTVEVIVPSPPPPPDTTPYSRHFEGAVVVGGAFVAMSTGPDPTASGLGPYLELEGAWQAYRHLVLAAHVGYTSFEDPTLTAVIGTINGQAIYGTYDVSEHIYEAGARVYARYGRLDVGVGLGAQLETGKAYADYNNYSNVLGLLDAITNLRVWQLQAISVDLRAVATLALGARDVESLRLALALRF
jgi:hypothetical protein